MDRIEVKTKHTPRPWSAVNIDEQGWTVVADDTVVAIVGGGGNGEDFDPAYEADARLIAAAPELLEALMAAQAADKADDEFREYCERANAEDWINDPTGSMHVNSARTRANDARQKSVTLRDAAIAKAGA